MVFTSIIADAFKVFDEAYTRSRRFILAYSGGKDSTATAILLYKWVLERRPRDLEVVILHNDTMSEILPMEAWARKFMSEFTARMEGLGIEVVREVATPEPTDTFYWRVFVRGYPAPTFNFRWCVDLLKLNPTRRVLARYRDYILIVGSRDEESAARVKSMRLGLVPA
ncbi:phosphoadenosine phosphosulfate reductase family protein [Vulcanisaeta sp. JCM 16159]|uniref:phosphoadenosine phosphosulfate reductase domain-containing protein n=1 Tax=Vulcanisaeta sp. JCM 16159 TaxID=1295371 RepID=UPI0006D212DC|nr:phosphoadenosine phosphosulfate reductase family protein [Vulcanisaeta sp. JCM 16159]